jgi:RNA polymerase sigma factor (sigma-70 family)
VHISQLWTANHQPFTSDAEARATMAAAQLGHEQARLRVLTAYSRLMKSRVRRVVDGTGVDLDDARQAAVLGVLRAVSEFAASNGGRSDVLVSNKISEELDALVDGRYTLHVPGRTRRRYGFILRAAGGDVRKAAEMAPGMGMTADVFWDCYRAQPPADGTAVEALPEDDHPAKRDEYAPTENAILARQALAALDDRERAVVELSFGFGGEEPMAEPEVGERLGLSRATVGRIKRSALAKMRPTLGVAA